MSNDQQEQDLLQRSVELLNEGALLIESGNLRYASVVLKSSLQISKQRVGEKRSEQEGQEQDGGREEEDLIMAKRVDEEDFESKLERQAEDI